MLTAVKDLTQQIFSSAILIVDDNEINRLFLEKTLRARGFSKILSVASAEQALIVLVHFQPEIVLLDIIMPDGMDGFDCCEAIRRELPYRDLPILVQTSITEPELRVKAFHKGATDFVSKPIHAEELCARVLVHLENRHSMKILQQYKYRTEIELEGAKQLQLSILPEEHDLSELERRGEVTIATYYEPCSEIGGDFWGMKSLYPRQTSLWLVDFSGHGVASALNAFRLQAYLKEFSPLATRPGEYLSHLNDKLLQLLMRGQFATMFYGIIDTQSSRLFYACACIPHPIILRKGTGKTDIIDGTDSPLGIGMHYYPTQTTTFGPGDIMVLYSDALTETPNDRGDFLTEQQLCAVLEKSAQKSANEIRDDLLDLFRQHTGGALRDDLSIVVCARATTKMA